MALFQHNNQTLAYQIDFAPFAHDLILLQSSKFNADYWRPVMDEFRDEAPAGGRVITCEWPLHDAAFMDRFLSMLGLHHAHVVAMGDAADLVREIEKIEPGVFAKTLLFPQGGPKAHDLVRTVREFSVP